MTLTYLLWRNSSTSFASLFRFLDLRHENGRVPLVQDIVNVVGKVFEFTQSVFQPVRVKLSTLNICEQILDVASLFLSFLTSVFTFFTIPTSSSIFPRARETSCLTSAEVKASAMVGAYRGNFSLESAEAIEWLP